jgi:hypothetical protein
MFRFYSDPAMTTPINVTMLAAMLGAAGNTPITAVVYFGSVEPGRRATALDGGDIVVSVSVTSGDVGAASVRLAGSESGLAAATPGDPLAIGVALESKTCVPVWIDLDPAAVIAGQAGAFSVSTNPLRDAPHV